MQWTLHTEPRPIVSGYQGNRRSPLAIAATVTVYGAAAAAFLLVPSKIILIGQDGGLITHNVPIDPVPPPLPPDPPIRKKVDDRPVTRVDDNMVKGLDRGGTVFADPRDDGRPTGGDTIWTKDPPPPEPVFTKATLDQRRIANVQPPYPGAMIRAQMEGFAKVHILIDAEGRVSSVELIEATDPAFWEATRKQALKYWRFRPATRDGVPVASDQIMTVRFRLADI